MTRMPAGALAVLLAVGSFADPPQEDKPFLGVNFGPGLSVSHAFKGGPADAAGIRPGDKLLMVGEVAVKAWTDVDTALAKRAVGDEQLP